MVAVPVLPLVFPMSDEGVEILLALESHQKPPLSEEEAEDLVKFFCGEEEDEPSETD